MRTVSFVMPLFLLASLACGPKPDKNNKKNPILTQPPNNTTQPADTKPASASAPVASAPVSAPTSSPSDSVIVSLPDISTLTEKGTEITEQQTFAYKFEKDLSANYQVSVSWKLKGLGIPLMADFAGAFVADLKMTVKEVDPQGTATAEVTYGRIQAQFDALLLQGKKSFDSKNPGPAPEPLLAPFGKMDGKSFTVKISKEGKITELVGQDKILDEALSDPAFPGALKDQIKAAIGEKGLTQLLGQGFLAFPNDQLKKGDSFRVNSPSLTIPGLGQVDIQEDVKLESVREIEGKKLGVFSLSIGAINSQDGASTVQLPGTSLAIEAKATFGDGFFAFDTSRGLPYMAVQAIPLDLNVSFIKDGKPATEQPINVVGEVALSAKLIE